MPENPKEVDYLYRPVDHLITEFASANGLILSYGDLGPWAGPGYELGWVSPKGHICRITLVTGGTPDAMTFSFTAICWGPSDMLGRKGWSVISARHPGNCLAG